ncbi:MAG: (2Fe-2S)-binding protein [Deltaproteobacteria bacterium]|nr:(2Fe-2S)-binding protein [Deltaproteobacteria bacterium]MBW1873019.1 (2Fe-2S)-binding protein [Deltaproteobacteria bacterium]
MSEVTIIIDGKEVQAQKGQRLLQVALKAGADIPNLCYLPGVEPPQNGCRLCWVEVEGLKKPVTSCTQVIEEGMVVHTRTPAVDRLVRSGFEMLMSVHRLDCKVCPGNRRCALQDIAKSRKIPLKPKRLNKIEPDLPIDESRPDLGFNPNHCVLCGHCVYVCNNEVKKKILDFSQRGLATVISTFDGRPLADQECDGCTRCAEVCPVGAIYLRQ